MATRLRGFISILFGVSPDKHYGEELNTSPQAVSPPSYDELFPTPAPAASSSDRHSDTIDDESALLMLELQRFEVITLLHHVRQSTGHRSDETRALVALRQDIDAGISTIRDHVLAEDITRFNDADQQLVEHMLHEERAAADDRDLAVRVDGDIRRRPVPTAECVCCMDTFDHNQIIRAPCGDAWCSTCLDRLFVAATNDESCYPPRCCGQTIALNAARLRLTRTTLQRYMRKVPEWETKNRLYCARSNCGAWIPHGRVIRDRDKARCPECDKTTCTLCRGKGHRGDCPADQTLQQLLAVAKASKWQRCYNCHRFVELNLGCNHIT